MTTGTVRARLHQNRSRNWAAWSPCPPCASCSPPWAPCASCSPWAAGPPCSSGSTCWRCPFGDSPAVAGPCSPPWAPWPWWLAWCSWWSMSPLLMAGRIPGGRSGTHQPGDGVGGLGHDRLGIAATGGHPVTDAVAQVPVQQVDRHALEGLVHGADLGQHIDAVGVLVDQPLQAPHLALDPPQPGERPLLVTGVPGHPPPSPARSSSIYPQRVSPGSPRRSRPGRPERP